MQVLPQSSKQVVVVDPMSGRVVPAVPPVVAGPV
jgi:hypothetical protein